MPDLNPDGTVYELPPPRDGREARAQAIAACTRCDADGYHGTVVCSHVDHAPAAARGRELVAGVLADIRKRQTERVRGSNADSVSDPLASTESDERSTSDHPDANGGAR